MINLSVRAASMLSCVLFGFGHLIRWAGLLVSKRKPFSTYYKTANAIYVVGVSSTLSTRIMLSLGVTEGKHV